MVFCYSSQNGQMLIFVYSDAEVLMTHFLKYKRYVSLIKTIMPFLEYINKEHSHFH